jgi:hypothetical protein
MMDQVAEIDRLTNQLRDTMAAYAAHLEALRLENPAAVPIQLAIIEKTLRDADLPRGLAAIERARQGYLSSEVRCAIDRWEAAYEEAAAYITSPLGVSAQ